MGIFDTPIVLVGIYDLVFRTARSDVNTAGGQRHVKNSHCMDTRQTYASLYPLVLEDGCFTQHFRVLRRRGLAFVDGHDGALSDIALPSEHSVVVPNQTGVCNYALSEMLVIEIYDTPGVTERLY